MQGEIRNSKNSWSQEMLKEMYTWILWEQVGQSRVQVRVPGGDDGQLKARLLNQDIE